MRVSFHPDFPKDIRRLEAEYSTISDGLATRFRREIDEALQVIKASPSGAGHFLNVRSGIVPELRRRNLTWRADSVPLGHKMTHPRRLCLTGTAFRLEGDKVRS